MSTPSATVQTTPSVAMDSSGGAIVVWQGEGVIAGRRYDKAARSLGSEFVVADTTGSILHGKPAVAADADGGFVVAWESSDPETSDCMIRGRRYDANGDAVGGEFQVDAAATDRQYHPIVAVDPGGGFLVVWEGHNLTRNLVDFSGIFARRYDDGGEPTGEEFQINSGDTRFAGSPAMAMDSTGNFVVAWEEVGTPSGTAGIFGRCYDAAGVARGAEFQINDPVTEAQLEFAPAVATDASGGFVVVWQRFMSFVIHVVGRRFGSGGVPTGGVFPVAADPGQTNSSPSVATLPSGDFLAFWEQVELGRRFGPRDIAAQHYLSDGTPDGGEIIVHHVRDGDLGAPAVSADASGNVTVVWSRLPRSGLAAGIFGHRYTVSSHTPRTGCAGDCDGDHRVTIDELIRGVTLLLDTAAHDTCPAADLDGGGVTIAELVAAINDAMNGCPAAGG